MRRTDNWVKVGISLALFFLIGGRGCLVLDGILGKCFCVSNYNDVFLRRERALLEILDR